MEKLTALRGAAERPPATLEYEGPIDGLRTSSIAIIIRIQGHSAPSLDEYLDSARGRPEILFIKRAVSPRDRWSGHVAVPGGRGELGESPVETAARETLEEVGLDLNQDGWLLGPLDQRLLRISWGRIVAMRLCPFVFVLNRWDAPLIVQPAEVSAAFWYPIDELTESCNATSELIPVGARMTLPRWLPGPVDRLVRWQAGSVSFPAIKLMPLVAEGAPLPPYHLWGVTLGVLQDLFYIADRGYVNKIQRPTLTAPDMRLLLGLLTYFHGRRKRQQLAQFLATGEGLDISNRLLSGYMRFFPAAAFGTMALRVALIGFIAAKLIYRLKRHI